MAKFNLYITVDGAEYELKTPLGYDGLAIETTRDNDNGFYRKTVSGAVRVGRKYEANLYDAMLGVFNDTSKYCDDIVLRVEKICNNGVQENYLTAISNVPNITHDLCKCVFSMNFEPDDLYRCLVANWEIEHSFYTQQTFPYDTRIGTVSQLVLTQAFNNPGGPNLPDGFIPIIVDDTVLNAAPYGGTDCEPNNLEWNDTLKQWDPARCPSEWWVRSTGLNILGTPDDFSVVTSYRREFVTSVTSPGLGWINIGGNDWVRQPAFPIIANETHTQGMSFNASLQVLVSSTGCVNGVISDFYNINPDGAAPTNSAYTYAENNLHDLLIQSQSDTKDPTATEHAQPSIFKASLKEVLNDLQNMHNIVWFIDGGNNLRIEHVSFLSSGAAIDICDNLCVVTGGGDAPNVESFRMVEQQTKYFDGENIVYENKCGEGTQEYANVLFNTDVYDIQANPESYSDKPFNLVATVVVNGNRYINSYNRPLSFTEMHPVLWDYDRYFQSGSVNGVNTTFQTTKYIKQSNELDCDCMCSDLTGNELVSTIVGDGRIESMSERLYSGKVKIKLSFQ